MAIIETCVEATRRAGTLEALATWCERLVGALRTRWPEASEELPLYPAFVCRRDRGTRAPAGAPG